MFNFHKYSQNIEGGDLLGNFDFTNITQDMSEGGEEQSIALQNPEDASDATDKLNPEQQEDIEITAQKLAWKSIYDRLSGMPNGDIIYNQLITFRPDFANSDVINANYETIEADATPEIKAQLSAALPQADQLIRENNITGLINLLDRLEKGDALQEQQMELMAFNLKKTKTAQNPMMEQQLQQSRFPVHGIYDFIEKFIDDILSWEGQKGKPSENDVRSNSAINEILDKVEKVDEGFYDTENDVRDLLVEVQQLDPVIEKEQAQKIMARVYKFLPKSVEVENQSMEQNIMAKKIEGIVKFNLSDHVLNNKSTKMTKEASAFQSQEYVLYGPTEKRICPKMRGRNLGSDVVSEYICRHHCLDGIVIDDNKTVCGEAIFRGNIMDKYSREYVDADGRPTGGYLNKRFEIDRNVPEENRMRLKPGETRKPRPPSQGNTEARMQDMRNKEGKKRDYRPDMNTGQPFNWTKDVDQNNVNVSQAERDRREKAMGHKLVEYTNKEKQENNPKVAFNLKKFKTASLSDMETDKFDFARGEDRMKTISNADLLGGIKDLQKVIEIQEESSKLGLSTPKLGYYHDELHTYVRELNRRKQMGQAGSEKPTKEAQSFNEEQYGKQGEKPCDKCQKKHKNQGPLCNKCSEERNLVEANKKAFNLKQHKEAQFEAKETNLPLTRPQKSRQQVIRERKDRGLPGWNPRRWQSKSKEKNPLTGEPEFKKGDPKGPEELGVRGRGRYDLPTWKEREEEKQREIDKMSREPDVTDPNTPTFNSPPEPSLSPAQELSKKWRGEEADLEPEIRERVENPLQSPEQDWTSSPEEEGLLNYQFEPGASMGRIEGIEGPTGEELDAIGSEPIEGEESLSPGGEWMSADKESLLNGAFNARSFEEVGDIWNQMRKAPGLTPEDQTEIRRGLAETVSRLFKETPAASRLEGPADSAFEEEESTAPYLEDENEPEQVGVDLEELMGVGPEEEDDSLGLGYSAKSKKQTKSGFNLKQYKKSNTKKKT